MMTIYHLPHPHGVFLIYRMTAPVVCNPFVAPPHLLCSVCVHFFRPQNLSCNNAQTIFSRDNVFLLFSFLICMFYLGFEIFSSGVRHLCVRLHKLDISILSCPAYARGRHHRLLNRSFHYYLANKSKYLPSVQNMKREKKRVPVSITQRI